MLRAAYGLEAPPTTEAARLDLRAYQAVLGLLDELEGWQKLGGGLSVEELVGALERAMVRTGSAREGHVAIVDLLRARTRQAEVVFVLGLEEGSLPRRSQPSAFLDDDRRRELDGERAAGEAPTRSPATATSSTPPAPAPRGACTSCARRRPTTARRVSRARSGTTSRPCFAAGGRRALDDAGAPLSALVWPIEGAPTERERLRALAWLSTRTAPPPARSRAPTAGSAASSARSARSTGRRGSPTRPCSQTLSERAMFGVTELETFAGCSSIWFVERLARPEDDGRGGGREDARLDRAPDAVQVLLRTAQAARRRARAGRAGWTRRSSSCASA